MRIIEKVFDDIKKTPIWIRYLLGFLALWALFGSVLQPHEFLVIGGFLLLSAGGYALVLFGGGYLLYLLLGDMPSLDQERVPADELEKQWIAFGKRLPFIIPTYGATTAALVALLPWSYNPDTVFTTVATLVTYLALLGGIQILAAWYLRHTMLRDIRKDILNGDYGLSPYERAERDAERIRT